MGTVKGFPKSAQVMMLDPSWRKAAVLSVNGSNDHRAAGEQDMNAARSGKSCFNLSLPPGEFYSVKKIQTLGGQLFNITNIRRGLHLPWGFTALGFAWNGKNTPVNCPIRHLILEC